MRKSLPQKIEKFRIKEGPLASDSSYGMNGFFIIKRKDRILRVQVSDQCGWDHVSVSLPDRTPTWKEMCFIKDIFFEDEETAVQFHPPKSQYVDYHPYCLHLWRNQEEAFKLPPQSFIGPK
jgi:hypothetical protein